MRPIDADKLRIDMSEKVFCGDCVIKTLGVSIHQISAAPTITLPPNDPLTMEQLLEMDGEPVYIKRIGSDHPDDSAWALVDAQNGVCRTGDGCKAFFMFYGKTWLAYRRKPEG